MSASASASASAAHPPGKVSTAGFRSVFGLDPGSVNGGLAEIDCKHGRVVSLERLQFRAPGTGGDDIGNKRIIAAVAAWIGANILRFKDAIIFIENQPPEAYGREAQAVQHTFQAFFGAACVPINAGAYKAHFAEHFPRHPKWLEFPPHRRSENQKTFDRRNAINSGRKFVPNHVREEYERKNPQKKDDAYEAYWIARYGMEFWLDENFEMRDTAKAAPRRKRSEAHPRGRPTIESVARAQAKAEKARAKAEAAPKAKPKPKPKAKAKRKAAADDDDDDDDVVDLTGRPTKRMRT